MALLACTHGRTEADYIRLESLLIDFNKQCQSFDPLMALLTCARGRIEANCVWLQPRTGPQPCANNNDDGWGDWGGDSDTATSKKRDPCPPGPPLSPPRFLQKGTPGATRY